MEKIPDGNKILKSTEDAAIRAINSTASSGHDPITTETERLGHRWQEFKDKLTLEETGLKDKEKLKMELESLVSEFAAWLEDAAIQQRKLEEKKGSTKEKKETLGPSQVSRVLVKFC